MITIITHVDSKVPNKLMLLNTFLPHCSWPEENAAMLNQELPCVCDGVEMATVVMRRKYKIRGTLQPWDEIIF